MNAATRKAYSDGCEDTHRQLSAVCQKEIDAAERRLAIAFETIAIQRATISELTIDANKWRAKLEKDRKYHAAKRDAAKMPAKRKAVAK